MRSPESAIKIHGNLHQLPMPLEGPQRPEWPGAELGWP
jgi:hypothetical protein